MALEHLRQAVAHGFVNVDMMQEDDDLRSLRGDVAFEAIGAAARQAGGAAPHPR